jgi:predicted DNA-binding transcriptional regulator AlpA
VRRTTARDTSRTSPDSYKNDLLHQRSPPVTSDSDPMTSSSTTPMLLTLRQVEAALQLGRTRTYELLRSGQLPMLRVSGIALEEWIAQQISALRVTTVWLTTPMPTWLAVPPHSTCEVLVE